VDCLSQTAWDSTQKAGGCAALEAASKAIMGGGNTTAHAGALSF
jgi:hypothetical protein